jgi:hypothetical protein
VNPEVDHAGGARRRNAGWASSQSAHADVQRLWRSVASMYGDGLESTGSGDSGRGGGDEGPVEQDFSPASGVSVKSPAA